MPFSPVTISDGQVSGVDSLSSAASSVINWEVDRAGINVPRGPLTDLGITNLAASPIIGGDRWSAYTVWASADRTLCAVPASSPTAAVSLSTSSSSTKLEGTAARATVVAGQSSVYFAGGGRVQYWNPALATSTVLAASPSCTHIASIGQRLVANNVAVPNNFYWSDIGEGAWTSWPAANFANADARPDPIVGIFENLNELLVFGDSTLQVYAVGSDPTFPFSQIATINTGLAAPYAAIRLDENIAYLDDRRRIVISDGRTIESISDAIQSDLRGLGTISDCFMYREERGTFSKLVVRFPKAMRTFAYDLNAKYWTERSYYSSPLQADYPVGAYVYWPSLNYHMVGSSLAGGGLYQIASTPGAELSSSLVCERVTGWHDHGSDNRKRSTRIRATLRRGTGTLNSNPGALELRVQNDDSGWSSWQQISVGQPYESDHVKDVFIGGIFRRRRYHVRFSTTETFSLVKLADEVTELPA